MMMKKINISKKNHVIARSVSSEAIQSRIQYIVRGSWIATAFGLAMTPFRNVQLGTLKLFSVIVMVAITNACPPVKVGGLSIVGHRWIRPSTGPNTAAYLTITNPSDEMDKLVKVECEDCNVVELHNNIDENGVMKMRPVSFIEIGKDPVELKPGGLHVMLMGLKDTFQGKDSIPLTLYFEKAGPVTINFSVKEPTHPADSKSN